MTTITRNTAAPARNVPPSAPPPAHDNATLRKRLDALLQAADSFGQERLAIEIALAALSIPQALALLKAARGRPAQRIDTTAAVYERRATPTQG